MMPIVISRSECSDKVWLRIIELCDEKIQLRRDIVALHKSLCKYEGHLPIHDSEDQVWCELCESKLEREAEG